MSTQDQFDPSRYGEADRRAVDPPIPVETVTWSRARELDWWVKEHRPRLEWWDEYAVRMAGSDGSELVIFAALAAHSHELPLPRC